MKYDLRSPALRKHYAPLQPYNVPSSGITFLVLKKSRRAYRVPTKRLHLDAENKRFLEAHYRVHPKSRYFFRVFRPTSKAKDWVEPNYASTGLQAVNTQYISRRYSP